MRPYLLISSGLLAYSGAVMAAETAPSWEVIGTGAIGVVVAMVGAYAKGISSRVDKLEDRVSDLNNEVFKNYHSKDDIERILRDIRASIHAIHRRLDAAGMPHRPEDYHGG